MGTFAFTGGKLRNRRPIKSTTMASTTTEMARRRSRFGPVPGISAPCAVAVKVPTDGPLGMACSWGILAIDVDNRILPDDDKVRIEKKARLPRGPASGKSASHNASTF